MEENINDKIERVIKEFVKNYNETRNVESKWESPLIAYTDPMDVPCSTINPLKRREFYAKL